MLLDNVRNAGIVGNGGAGFPTHVKLNAAEVEYLIMNAAECEPLLRVDQQLMVEYSDPILEGFAACARHLGVKKAIIGIKKKHVAAIVHLRQRIEDLHLGELITIHELNDVYPAGDEQVLVYEVTGRSVPEAGLPLDVGCVVINSETTLNVARSLEGQNVTHTFITLAGDIPNRATFEVPLGMSIRDVLKLSGVENLEDYAVIDGGPMMGPVMGSIDKPITKKHKGFILLKYDHPLIDRKRPNLNRFRRVNRAACEQCRMCTDLCPRYLLGHNLQPHKMMTATTYRFSKAEENQMALLCCQCGLCTLFACPANLYPREANIIMMGELAKEGIRYEPIKNHFEAHSQRPYRQLPSHRLIHRLQLDAYDLPAPLVTVDLQPERVKIARVQHVGAPAEPIVVVGDRVQEGQMIGDIPEGKLGATIHSSIDGVVEEISNDAIIIRRA